MSTTQDDFEQLLFEMDDALDAFIRDVPNDIRDRLDYSVNSLSVVEKWLLAKYASPNAIIAETAKRDLEHVSIYVGETFRKNIGGRWTIDLENPKNAYFQIPVLRKNGAWEKCPYTLVTASLDRRTGDFMEKILMKNML